MLADCGEVITQQYGIRMYVWSVGCSMSRVSSCVSTFVRCCTRYGPMNLSANEYLFIFFHWRKCLFKSLLISIGDACITSNWSLNSLHWAYTSRAFVDKREWASARVWAWHVFVSTRVPWCCFQTCLWATCNWRLMLKVTTKTWSQRLIHSTQLNRAFSTSSERFGCSCDSVESSCKSDHSVRSDPTRLDWMKRTSVVTQLQ
jgi:hypothetical protein